ncbi:C40 family peptidase [Arthrobacter sp. MSA 4-2]|uniref:C40 family peptidase n=1 Tax=Arthrobacter sp. MSA 4-2 TaxID=2794349 RepID=UPI0018E846C3|nr:C40 family peptidase [Arthrobacter sp. MSA 4-2]MBJ2120028.1 C40 family peptidase [Arthrobacter sp. MSA 4-2]
MSKNRTIARHRATPVRTSPLKTATRAVAATAGVAGRPAAVVVAASGILLGATLPANAAGEVEVSTSASQVSAPAVQAAPAPAASATSHTVVAGDTLGSIAGKYGVSLDAVFAANGMGWDSVIYPGQTIVLSGNAVAAAPQPAAAVQAFAPAPQAAPAQTASTASNPMGTSSQSNEMRVIGAASTSGIVGTALQGIGSGYVFGGTGFGGWDCSGFVQWVYAQHGIDLPRTTWSQFAALTPTGNPQPGDLVSQNGGSHVGIYLGNGKMVSALNPSQGTLVHDVSAMSVDGYYTAG